uniref:Uncharacterized protein n=1 Tax=Anguilla anguilla TaxID=7936 RepID=A0A0E9W6U9_ANGAN
MILSLKLQGVLCHVSHLMCFGVFGVLVFREVVLTESKILSV